MLKQDLRRAQHMTGGQKADLDSAQPNTLAIGDRRSIGRAIAQPHDRQSLGRRPADAMAAASMIAVAMGDQRAIDRHRRIDPGIRRPDINPARGRFDPMHHQT